MNLGFELTSEAAKPKRATEDAPAQVSMRRQKLRRNPDADQKKARRQLRRKTATPEEDLEDMWGPGSVQCPLCGGDGTKVDGTRCPMCMGDGKVTRARAAALRLRADTGPADAPPRNRHDLGNEPIGHLPGAPITESGGEGGGGWGYVPYPSYGEGGEVNITYVDEHGHRSKDQPTNWPKSNQAPPSKSYIPPNTWAASLQEPSVEHTAAGQVEQKGNLEIWVHHHPGFDDGLGDWHWEVLDTTRSMIGNMGQTVDDGYVQTEAEAWSKARGVADALAQQSGQLFASKESDNVNFNRREAELLSAMAGASLSEQAMLAAELTELRNQRAAAIEEDRSIDVGAAIVADHLTPVLTHGLNTTATDWLGSEGEEEIDAEAAVLKARAEAGAWFERTSSYVRADRDEFAEQAMGKARVVASQFGSAADAAKRAFLDTVSFLHRRTAEDATVVDPLPDSAPGLEQPNTTPWNERVTTGDTAAEATASLQTQADDSPGKVDEDQSGNAESTITDYNTQGNDPGTFDEIVNGPLQPTGPVEVPSTRAPNVTGSRDLQTIAADIMRDWTSMAPAAEPYVQAMGRLGSVEDRFGSESGRDIAAYFLANAAAWRGEKAAAVKAELRAMLDGVHGVVADSQNGEAKSDLKDVEVGSANDRPMWPWEMPELPGETGSDASNVGGTHTPGQSVDDYPQPKKGELQSEAGFPMCAAGCNRTLSAADELIDTTSGLAHSSCVMSGLQPGEQVGAATGEPMIQQGVSLGEGEVGTLDSTAGGGLDNLGDNKAPPFGKGDGDGDEDDQKTAGVDQAKLAAFRERVAANLGS